MEGGLATEIGAFWCRGNSLGSGTGFMPLVVLSPVLLCDDAHIRWVIVLTTGALKIARCLSRTRSGQMALLSCGWPNQKPRGAILKQRAKRAAGG